MPTWVWVAACIVVAAVVLAVGLSSGGGGSASNSNSGGGSSVSNDSGGGGGSTSLVSTQTAWGTDSCLHSYILISGTVEAVTASDLCRSPVTETDGSSGYAVFPRGESSNNWVAVYETPGDGYIYLFFPNLPALRTDMSGQNVEIDTDSGYMPIETYYLQAGIVQAVKYEIGYSEANTRLSQLISATYTGTVSSDPSADQSAVSSGQSQLSSSASQVTQQASSTGGASSSNAEQIVIQEDQIEGQGALIMASPGCAQSDQGCGDW